MNRHCATRILFGLVATATLAAQQTLHVGPGQPFADIQAAISASSPGDTIAVRKLGSNASYPPFSVTHSLTIRTEPPAPDLQSQAIGQLFTIALGAGDQVHLQDLRFLQDPYVQSTITGGLVEMERVTLTIAIAGPVYPYSVLLAATQSSVILRGCMQRNGVTEFDQCAVAGVDCDLVGASIFNAIPTPVLDLQRSTAYLSHCTVRSIYPYGGAPGIVLGNSRLDLVDCQIAGQASPPYNPVPSPSIVVDAASLARQHRCTFDSGTGSGTGIVGVVQPFVHLGATMPEAGLLLGGSMTAQFRAEPFDPVFVMASFAIAPPSPAPLVEPEQWGFAAQGFVVGVQSADAAGDATYGISIPNQPALRGVGIWLMGVSGSSVPLRMSVPLGGKLQ